MTSELDHALRKATGRLVVAWILISAGLLIMVGSGGCSLFFLGSMGGGADMIGVVSLFGGVPFLVGLALLMAGRRMLRPPRRKGAGP